MRLAGRGSTLRALQLPGGSATPIGRRRSSACLAQLPRSSSHVPQQPHQRRQRQAPAVVPAAAAAEPPPLDDEGEEQQPPAPFSEAELRELSEWEEEAEDDALAADWQDGFAADLDGLYAYVDRQQDAFEEQVAGLRSVPKHLWEQMGLMDRLQRHPAGVASEMVGMGSWRLKGRVDEVFEFLVTRIEGSLRELLDTDLALYPPDKWKARGWDFIDSLDPAKEWGRFSYVDMPDPLKGAEGYPRLLIENRLYSSRAFRKLHLELAVRQDGLQVLHLVFYPRYDFDLPILALDLVAAGGAVSLAIADACPLSPRLELPPHYAATMQQLQDNFLPDSLQARTIPDWGKQIFSPLCVCMRPSSPQELAGFMKYVVALTRAHIMYSNLLQPLSPVDKRSARRLSQLMAGHERFCEQQLANTKTSRVLEVAFDSAFTDAYMRQLMFDYAPREDVPWFDGSLAKLYHYFDSTPELWADAGEFLKTKLQLDEAKASEYLRRFLAGDASIKLPRLGFALQHMYDTDADFSQAVDASLLGKDPDEVPHLAGDMGEYLANELMQLVYNRTFEQEEAAAAEAARQQLEVGAEPGAAAAAAAAAAAGSAGEQQQQQQPGGGGSSKAS